MRMSTNGYGYILRNNKWLWLYLTEQQMVMVIFNGTTNGYGYI